MTDKKRNIPVDSAVLLLLFLELACSLATRFVGGVAGTCLHYASYLIPILLFIFFFARPQELSLRPTAEGFFRVLPLLPIFLASVLLLSTATAYLMTLFGLPTIGGSIGEGAFPMLFLRHSLLPAVLEEGLMRLCVLSLLARRSPARAVPQSALLFALLHASLYQLPYAFVGGIFLALAALLGGSVLYAFLFHLLNNLLSLLMQSLPYWIGETAGLYGNLFISLVLFLLAAWGILVLLRRRGQAAPPDVRGWLKELLCSPLLIYVMLMLLYICF